MLWILGEVTQFDLIFAVRYRKVMNQKAKSRVLKALYRAARALHSHPGER
jgi:hypothetical protein